MEFQERLVKLRLLKGLTQEDLASVVGITRRSIVHFEQGTRTPSTATLLKLADALGVKKEALISDDEYFVVEAAEKYGSAGKKQAQELVNNAHALFAGGTISDEDKEEVLKAITEAYWESKLINKKYTPKKYRKKSDNGE